MFAFTVLRWNLKLNQNPRQPANKPVAHRPYRVDLLIPELIAAGEVGRYADKVQ